MSVGEAASFELKNVVSGGTHTLVLTAEIDMLAAPELDEAIRRLCVEGTSEIALDLRKSRSWTPPGYGQSLPRSRPARKPNSGFRSSPARHRCSTFSRSPGYSITFRSHTPRTRLPSPQRGIGTLGPPTAKMRLRLAPRAQPAAHPSRCCSTRALFAPLLLHLRCRRPRSLRAWLGWQRTSPPRPAFPRGVRPRQLAMQETTPAGGVLATARTDALPGLVRVDHAPSKLTVFVLALVVMTAGLGCGGTISRQGAGRATTTVPQPKTAGNSQTPSVAEGANHEGRGTVPEETGVRLDVAVRDLARRKLPYRVVGGTASTLGTQRRWLVCETSPSPRTHLESGTVIRLIIARACRPGAP